MRLLLLAVAAFSLMAMFASSAAYAHCEVPCGIFDDSTRFVMMAEDIRTVEKSMAQVDTLSKAGDKNYNQIVRWITTKEDHAQKIIDVCSQYFLAQRVKPVEATDPNFAAYQNKVLLLHQIIITAVKCKQTTDPANTARLTELMNAFRAAYFGEHGHTH